MRPMHRAIGVDMHVGRHATGHLGFQYTVERRSGVLSNEEARPQRVAAGDHYRCAVFVQYVDRTPVEKVAILTKDKGFRPFAYNRRLG